MVNTGSENDLVHLYIRLNGETDVNEICYTLRGLFVAVGNSDGQAKKNQQFRRGVTITFGSGAIAGTFIEKFERIFRKSVRNRVMIQRC